MLARRAIRRSARPCPWRELDRFGDQLPASRSRGHQHGPLSRDAGLSAAARGIGRDPARASVLDDVTRGVVDELIPGPSEAQPRISLVALRSVLAIRPGLPVDAVLAGRTGLSGQPGRPGRPFLVP